MPRAKNSKRDVQWAPKMGKGSLAIFEFRDAPREIWNFGSVGDLSPSSLPISVRIRREGVVSGLII